MPMPPGTIAGLLAQIDSTTTPDGCWPWTGHVDEHGRVGRIRIGGRRVSVTRTIVERAAGGRRLRSGTRVRRSCGNIICLRPTHLFVTAGA